MPLNREPGPLPEGGIPVSPGDGRSKSAVSRRFVELSAERMTRWLASDLLQLDLLAILIDGPHEEDGLVLVAAVGFDAAGVKHSLAVMEGATENAATGAGAAREPGWTWARPGGLPLVHCRWRQGADLGDPPHLRSAYADATLSAS